MKIILAVTIFAILGLCYAAPAAPSSQQDLDVDDLINRLQQWKQSLTDEYEGEMPRYQRASNRYNYPPSPYRGYFFGERSHRSLDSLGGGNLLKRALPIQLH